MKKAASAYRAKPPWPTATRKCREKVAVLPREKTGCPRIIPGVNAVRVSGLKASVAKVEHDSKASVAKARALKDPAPKEPAARAAILAVMTGVAVAVLRAETIAAVAVAADDLDTEPADV
jgi:hypothetical protein